MAIDLVCGQCQGRLIAEQSGGVVACPHCGTHLQVPAESMNELSSADDPLPTAGEFVSSTLEPADDLAVEPTEQLPGPMVSVEQSLLIEVPNIAEKDTSSFLEPAAAADNPLPAISPGETVPPAMVPRSLFLLVASYASALTLAFVFLLIQYLYLPTHRLENLPDVVPEIHNGEVALKVAPPEANVAPGHVLKIGESRRYGSLKVTPLRVTQGSLQFEHAWNDPLAERPPSEPVLKLWLRFENVSRNQRFSPLDPLLLFKRHYQGLGQPDLTNQFLCQADQRRADGTFHYLFELSPTSEFRIAGQQLETVLGPGDSLETFVPSAETIDDLTGDLVWRVQFRKGYHPRSRHGVTTLIDVPFHRNDVNLES